MKLSKVSQLVLVSVLGIASAVVVSGCAIVNIDYLFVADSAGTTAGSAGQIQSMEVDDVSGALHLVGTAVPSGGTNPVSLATTADTLNLYAANQGNNSLVHFAINGDGTITQKDLVTVAFKPAAIAVNQAGTYLYVVGGSNPGQLAVYPISSAGAIGTLASTKTLVVPGYTSDITVPTGVAVLQNSGGVYVTVWDQSAYNPSGAVTSSANPGWVFGFTAGTGGALTATANSPYQAGVKPVGIALYPSTPALYAYVVDYASNELIGYSIQSSGALNYLVNGPFKTANQPTSLVIDPRGEYIYAPNSLSNTVSAWSITISSGTPTITIAPSGNGAAQTDTEPVAVVVDPALGRFVYTANYLGNSVSGFNLDPNTGALTVTQSNPYPTGAYPTAIAAVPRGNHAIQSVTP